jgi:hypothetical protein
MQSCPPVASQRTADTARYRNAVEEVGASVLSSSGRPLEPDVRADMENRFGHDFSRIRVHTERDVAGSARLLHANAFALGDHIGFRDGAYAPGTEAGRSLLVHELTHCVQQCRGGGGSSRSAEVEASANAVSAAVPGTQLRVSQGTRVQLSCSIDEWENRTPDISTWDFDRVRSNLDEIEEWFPRQTTSSEKGMRLEIAKQQLEARLAELGKGVEKEAKRPGKRRNRSKEKPKDYGDMPMPRILAERRSIVYDDPEELKAEVNRIVAWLQRDDVSKGDRKILRLELSHLAPQYDQTRAQRSQQRQAALLGRALTPSVDQEAYEYPIESGALVDSIKPLAGHPGLSYMMRGSEIVAMTDEQAADIRKQMRKLLEKAALDMEDANHQLTQDWDAWYKKNYEDHEYIGFLVSVRSGEDPMDQYARFWPHLANSNGQLVRYRALRDANGSFADMAAFVANSARIGDGARYLFEEGVNRSLSNAATLTKGLMIMRALGMAAGAVLATPYALSLASGFSTGLGLTGGWAAANTTFVTGGLLGGVGAVQAGAPELVGGLMAGQGWDASWKSAKGEAWSGAKQNFAGGVGAGTALQLGRWFGVGREGLSKTQNILRAGAAGSGGNLAGGFLGAKLEGKDTIGSLKAGLLNMPSGFLSGGLGVGTGYLNNRALGETLNVLGSTAIGVGDVAMRGGSTEDMIAAAGSALVTARSLQIGPGSLSKWSNWGANRGRDVTRTARNLALSTQLGVDRFIPRAPGGSLGALVDRRFGAQGLQPPSLRAPAISSFENAPDLPRPVVDERAPQPRDVQGAQQPDAPIANEQAPQGAATTAAIANREAKNAAYRKEQDALRRQAQEDRDYERQVGDTEQHEAREKSREQKRDDDRAAALETERRVPAEASRKAMALYEAARAGAYTHLRDKKKSALVRRFERLMRTAGWSVQKSNPMKGNFDEYLRTPTDAAAQQTYLAGGLSVEGQGRRGTARPDYTEHTGGSSGPSKMQANLKSNNIDYLNETELMSLAEVHTEQAIRNARQYASRDTVGVRYRTRPRDDFGVSVRLEEAMNDIHFAPGSPISDVWYGTVHYTNPNLP